MAGFFNHPTPPLAGSNAYGQGGAAGAFNGSLVNALSAGAFHTCGLESEQRLFCFGRNTHGQLGSLVNVGTATATPDPVLVVVQIGNVTYEGSWRAVSAGGNHTCAIFAGDSGLYCFGSNAAGQLGTGKPGIALPEPRPQRAKAPGDVTGWRAVSAGGTMTCAVSLDGRLYCFGTLVSEATGAALFSSREPLLLPFPAGVKGWATVAVGSNHMCALGSNNQLYCLGSNLYGQLGTGAAGVSDGSGQPPDATALVQAVLPPTVLVGYKDVSAGESHTCAVCTGGNMYCFGRNSHGQLGSPGAAGSDAATPLATVITKAPGVRSWSRVVCGGRHTCGLSSADQAFCFGARVGCAACLPWRHYTLHTAPSGQTLEGCGVGTLPPADHATPLCFSAPVINALRRSCS